MVAQRLAGVDALSLASGNACARLSSGELQCWEDPDYASLYGAPPGNITEAVVSAGGFRLARDRDGVVWAWGPNGLGQLGVGDLLPHSDPTPIPGLSLP